MTGALGLACGMDASEVPSAAGPVVGTACATVAAGGGWWNQTFADQGRRFHVELDATPSASPIDAVIGLATRKAGDLAQLGAIARFSPAGTIDVRTGAGYGADVSWPYQAGVPVHLRLDVNVAAHSYSVWVRNAFGGYTALARDYLFGTEQAGAAQLGDVASKVDSATGAVALCGVAMVADATTADGCVIADAGAGFVSLPVRDATVLDTVTFSATASVLDIDGVIGLSAGPAANLADLAVAARLAPSGMIDARDGDGYRADVARTYGAGAVDVRVIADVTSHRYSVFQGTYDDAKEIARQYGFRPQQTAVAHLDHLSAIVNGGKGSLAICETNAAASSGVAYSREGNVAVLPLADGAALLGDGATTVKLDAAGRVVGQLARGGELGADAAGNVFVASIAGTMLTVAKYDPGLALQWQATRTVPAGTGVGMVASDASGGVAVRTGAQDRTVRVTRFTAGGVFASELSVAGDAATLDGDQAIVAWNDSGALRITRYAATGATVWTRSFAGQANVTAMTVDPDHNLLFGGELFTAMDLGGGALPLRATDDGKLNAFFVKLSPGGDHVFSRKTGYTQVGGIASNGPRIVVSGTEQTQFHYLHLQSFDAAGTPVDTRATTGFGDHGFGGTVMMGSTGRVWWNLQTQWPYFPAWPYLVALDQ
ncbi:MAG: hypothetical protein E6J90_11675 [Deltaproteobacteria bacterium]|nr:MAG: hypothetical protein E6J90_11675 [Deltaproteobacteria bacterium]